MTGVCHAVACDFSPVIVGVATVADVKAGTNAIGNIAVWNDGRLQSAGSASVCPPYWWIANQTNGLTQTLPINVYVSLVVNSGVAPGTTPGSGVLLINGTSTSIWQWTETAVGTLSANCTLKFWSDAAGTSPLGQVTFTVSVQRTS